MRVNFRYGGQIYGFVHPDGDWIGTQQDYDKSFYEEKLLSTLGSYVPPSKVVIDVGAHVGNHSVFFASQLDAIVLACEPQRQLLPYLVRNTQEYAVTVLNCALGAPPHDMVVVDANDPAHLERGSVRYAQGYHAATVPCYTLDALALRFAPALIKIDVSGFEMEVLRGALGTIRAHRPVLVTTAQTRADFEAQDSLLTDYGYVSAEPFGAHTYLWTQEDHEPRRPAA